MSLLHASDDRVAAWGGTYLIACSYITPPTYDVAVVFRKKNVSHLVTAYMSVYLQSLQGVYDHSEYLQSLQGVYDHFGQFDDFLLFELHSYDL